MIVITLIWWGLCYTFVYHTFCVVNDGYLSFIKRVLLPILTTLCKNQPIIGCGGAITIESQVPLFLCRCLMAGTILILCFIFPFLEKCLSELRILKSVLREGMILYFQYFKLCIPYYISRYQSVVLLNFCKGVSNCTIKLGLMLFHEFEYLSMLYG